MCGEGETHWQIVWWLLVVEEDGDIPEHLKAARAAEQLVGQDHSVPILMPESVLVAPRRVVVLVVVVLMLEHLEPSAMVVPVEFNLEVAVAVATTVVVAAATTAEHGVLVVVEDRATPIHQRRMLSMHRGFVRVLAMVR